MAETRDIGFDEDDALRRAFAAHFRTGGVDQPSNTSGVEEHDGRFYVVLRGGRGPGPLRVYRVLPGGKLKGLRRWPKEIEGRP